MAAPKGYWQAVRAICDKHGILLHLDEIMCGMGRMGTYFAFEQEDIKPDIVTIGKGLGGGYTVISAMLINDKVLGGIRGGTKAFNHGHTFQAHPVACAIALKVQQILKEGRLVEQCAERGKYLNKLLRDAFTGAKHVADIRGRGLFQTIEFMRDPMTKTPFAKDVAFGSKVQLAAFDLGVAVYPGAGTVNGEQGDHVLFAPPFTVTDEELESAVSAVKNAYDAKIVELTDSELGNA